MRPALRVLRDLCVLCVLRHRGGGGRRLLAAATGCLGLLAGTAPTAAASVAVPSSESSTSTAAPSQPPPTPGTAGATVADAASGQPVASGARWRWPLAPPPALGRRYAAPDSAWGAGHRGLDLLGFPGGPVLAVEGGVVTHVGSVAGRGTVTVRHGDGLRSTYEPVDAVVRLGDTVSAGAMLGRLAAAGSHCDTVCLHLGALRGDGYLDPEPLLVRRRIILLPLP